MSLPGARRWQHARGVAHTRGMIRDALSRLARAWLVTAIVDALFSSALAVFAYRSTVTRLWQGVASVLLGPAAFQGGARTTLVGLLLHCGVALSWSAVFLALYLSWPRLRRALASRGGVIAVAALYGPAIWLVMSLAVIPLLTGRPPAIGFRWWVQLVGHIPFVAVPIVAMIRRPAGELAGGAGRTPATASGA
jgi:hypothetical protein